MVVQTSQYVAGCFYADTSGLFNARTTTLADEKDEKEKDGKDAAAALHGVIDADAQSQWLVLVRPQGILEVIPPLCIFILPRISSTDTVDLGSPQTDTRIFYFPLGSAC
jgi:cleavage and polyadenylation specificity factor subunit 1